MNRNMWLGLVGLLGTTWGTPPGATAASQIPPTVLAQVDSLHPGLLRTDERVRITSFPSRTTWTGHVAWYTADTVVLREKHARIPTASIRTIERSMDRHSKAGTGAMAGALLGGTVLGLTAGAVAATDDPEYAALTVPASVIGGALIGLTIGAVVGSTIHTESWIPVASQPHMARPGDRVRLKGPLIPGEHVTGTLAERTTDTLYVMRDEARVAVPLMSPLSMEVSLGVTKPSSNTAKVLGTLGMVAGAVAGGYFLGHDTGGWTYTSGILTGAAVGGTGGWMLGRTLSRLGNDERWTGVDWR
jgi:hypothetical protein